MWLTSFIDCPSCKKERSLGWLVFKSKIDEPSLMQACKYCRYSKSHPLPSLNKKVIYIDQFFFSDVLKIQKPEYRKSNYHNPHFSFFDEAWKKLEQLYLQQLIICPYSWSHKTETLEFSNPNDLQLYYEKFSNGVFFYDPFSIYKEEISKDFLHSISGEKKLIVDDILYGNRNAWPMPYRVSSQLGQRNVENKKFIERMQQIINHFLMKSNANSTKNFSNCYKNIVQDLINFYLEDGLFIQELNKYRRIALPPSQRKELTKNFLSQNIPHAQTIKCMAVIMATFVQQSTQSVNKGMFFDINSIASLLPFCDAIFIDTEMYNVLKFKYAAEITKEHQSKIFSLNNKDAFLE